MTARIIPMPQRPGINPPAPVDPLQLAFEQINDDAFAALDLIKDYRRANLNGLAFETLLDALSEHLNAIIVNSETIP